MTESEFFASLDDSQPQESLAQILQRFPELFAATTGLDKKPQLWPVRFLFAQDGSLWFATAKCARYYAEISMTPALTLGVYAAETGTFIRLRGKALFSEDKTLVARCLKEDPNLTAAWGEDPNLYIAYTLTGVQAEITSISPDIPARTLRVGDSESLLQGITLKKKTELRDRLSRLMERREAEGPKLSADNGIVDGAEPLPAAGLERETALFAQKLYDGALLYFAETAKALWPRFNIQPIERSVLFETYNEREQFTALAKRLIGNTVIDKPEDLTYYINPETLLERYKQTRP